MSKKEFMANVELNHQSITLSGVNQHSQNGIAERNIRTVCDRARTMLLHAILRWPQTVSVEMWPFALKLAVDIHNATPGPSGLSPEEIFSRQKARQDRLTDFHTFGCPVFVLEPCLQQGLKIPKWQLRSRPAVYLGHSPRHANTVPIVYNLRTGHCSPQYHVMFDDQFSTVSYLEHNMPPPHWLDLFQHSSINLFQDDPDIASTLSLGPEWTEPEGVSLLSEGVTTTPTILSREVDPATAQYDAVASPTPFVGDPAMTPTDALASPPLSSSDPAGVQHDAPASAASLPLPGFDPAGAQHDAPASVPLVTAEPVPASSDTIRPGWNSSHSHNTRFKARLQANMSCVRPYLGHHVPPVQPPVTDQLLSMVAHIKAVHTLEDGTANYTCPLALAASADTKDTLNYGEMLLAHDRSHFVTAMKKEMDGLRDVLQPCPRSHLPVNEKALPAVWSFKRKCLPDWSIVKWKARLNVHGG